MPLGKRWSKGEKYASSLWHQAKSFPDLTSALDQDKPKGRVSHLSYAQVRLNVPSERSKGYHDEGRTETNGSIEVVRVLTPDYASRCCERRPTRRSGGSCCRAEMHESRRKMREKKEKKNKCGPIRRKKRRNGHRGRVVGEAWKRVASPAVGSRGRVVYHQDWPPGPPGLP